jgi:hypothetical protein
MFAFAMPTRAPRSPERLAQGVVTRETRPFAGGARAGGRGATPGPMARADPQAARREGALYTLRISYPDGQKDEYRITVMPAVPLIPGPRAPRSPAVPEAPKPSPG